MDDTGSRRTRARRMMVTLAASLIAALPVAAHSQTGAGAGGQRLFLRCQTCHEVAAGAPDKVGPNLKGFAGRKAAAVAGFPYSAALRKSGVVWTDAALDRWLQRPASLVPGTTMAFVGLPRPEDRAALIAWLKHATR